MGWNLLLNEHVYLHKDDQEIAIIGVENWSSIRRFSRHGNLSKALKGINPDCFKILLSHDPTHWDTQVVGKVPIHLTFSGHTHGMQLGIEIPFSNGALQNLCFLTGLVYMKLIINFYM